ncbi:hypothetical protein CP97_00695 [Aurantiacibacter atlanticus]|uniref:Uncharacterized protein n=1 Tax=Aurantiacibacter atlanticus TaxID=1648404 RepID=A0A0H4VV03_9SPHN|nr:hypothetical protein CP97_00695 [Aurantiacibacter atlanticus]
MNAIRIMSPSYKHVSCESARPRLRPEGLEAQGVTSSPLQGAVIHGLPPPFFVCTSFIAYFLLGVLQ